MLDGILNLDWKVQISLLFAIVLVVWFLRETIAKILENKFTSSDMKDYARYNQRTKSFSGDVETTFKNWKTTKK